MTVREKKRLTIVDLPEGGRALNAPPVLVASTHTVDYCCGTCGVVLLHADSGQVHSLLIRCSQCGTVNSTEN